MEKLVRKLLILVNCIHGFLAVDDLCAKNRTLLEVPGDAVITVFIDVNDGPYCNETTLKGFQEVSTAVHVARMLNKHNYVPEMSIGLRIFDTCHDKVVVYKQALTALTALDCAINYELSILVSERYAEVVGPFVNYNILQINYYSESNFSAPLAEATLDFISGKFEVIDLLLTSASVSADKLLHVARQRGVCIQHHQTVANVKNDTDIVVLAVGQSDDVRSWLRNVDRNIKVTWVVLPVDAAYEDESLPVGSYIVQSEPIESTAQNPASLNPLEKYINATKRSIIHSPYLLSLGRSIAQISKSLQNMKKDLCSEASCTLPPYNHTFAKDISTSELYETLGVAENARYVKFSVVKKVSEDESIKVASIKVTPNGLGYEVTPAVEKLERLCLNNFAELCANCTNFRTRISEDYEDEEEESEPGQVLRANEWVIVYLTLAYSATFACVVIAVFIIYRYFTEDFLDGNPALTIFLVLANVFLLQTVLLFCLDERHLGPDHLNSRRIFVTTLAYGLLFSIILSRALFLAFSTGGTFSTGHVNGYLQSFMVFFMAGVQIAISTAYLLLSSEDPGVVLRSLMFVALLGYDIFLLIALFVTSCFIAQVQRNYREGKCFFATVIGLLIVWAIWLTCFILVEPEMRDIIVCFGIVATSLFVIIGILIPRTYFMVTHFRRDKSLAHRFGPVDFGPDPRMNNAARQNQQPFYEYIRPAEGLTGFSTLPVEGYPNYYGTSSPSARYFDRTGLSEPRVPSAYNNYGFHSEMRELENTYVVPRVCVENPDGYVTQLPKTDANGSRAQHRKPKLILREKDCTETDIYMEDRRLSSSRRKPNEKYLSRCSSPKLDHVDATIREEDEYEEAISRMTKF